MPVDYEASRQATQSIVEAAPPALMQQWGDGRIKLLITRKLVRFRREHPALFQSGEFIRLRVTGAHADSCFAFLRRLGSEYILVVVPRLTQRVGFPPIGERWRDTAIELPAGWHGESVRDLFTGAELRPSQDTLPVAGLLKDLPVAVCHGGLEA